MWSAIRTLKRVRYIQAPFQVLIVLPIETVHSHNIHTAAPRLTDGSVAVIVPHLPSPNIGWRLIIQPMQWQCSAIKCRIEESLGVPSVREVFRAIWSPQLAHAAVVRREPSPSVGEHTDGQKGRSVRIQRGQPSWVWKLLCICFLQEMERWGGEDLSLRTKLICNWNQTKHAHQLWCYEWRGHQKWFVLSVTISSTPEPLYPICD